MPLLLSYCIYHPNVVKKKFFTQLHTTNLTLDILVLFVPVIYYGGKMLKLLWLVGQRHK